MFLNKEKLIKYKKELIIRERTDRKVPKYLFTIVKNDHIKDFTTFYTLEATKKYIDRLKEGK